MTEFIWIYIFNSKEIQLCHVNWDILLPNLNDINLFFVIVSHFHKCNKSQYLLGNYPRGQYYYQFLKSRSVWWIACQLKRKKEKKSFISLSFNTKGYSNCVSLKINWDPDNKITPLNSCQPSQNNICQCLFFLSNFTVVNKWKWNSILKLN